MAGATKTMTWTTPGVAAVTAAARRVVPTEVHAHLDEHRAEVLAFTAFPKAVWRQIWSNNPIAPQPRDPPTHRRLGIFPDRDSIFRLVGAVLAEQNDEWADGRRYLGLDVLAKSRLTLITTETTEEEATTTSAISA